MHKESLLEMGLNLNEFASGLILDVGSLDVKGKGSYRTVIPKKCSYIGADIVSGPNVDVIMLPDEIPYPDNYFDTVISGQCFEHVENPFLLIKECSRVLKPNGYFIGVAPFVFHIHHLVDCWRIAPDGWISLFKHANLKPVETYLIGIDGKRSDGRRLKDVEQLDCWGIAKK